MEKLKVLIVDDDFRHRKTLSEIVEKTGMGIVVRTSSNGSLALEWLKHYEVNVVLLDAVLSGDSSLDVLKNIKKGSAAVEVILLSDGSPLSVETTLAGLKCGALDFIQIFSGSESEIHEDAVKSRLMILFGQIKIKRSFHTLRLSDASDFRSPTTSTSRESQKDVAAQFDALRWNQADLVLIAASTGGPAALEVVCSSFPSDFAKPVLIVQHIPAEFTRALVESLNKKCRIHIAEGRDGIVIGKRSFLIAPGGVHMVVQNSRGTEKTIGLENTPYVNGVRPAADVLFKSIARAYEGKNILVVILTGMGNDGMSGVMEIKKKCNCYCIIQSENTCVVYGMPRCVYEAGLADEVVDLPNITPRICEIVSGRS